MSDRSAVILIAEDEIHIRNALKRNLTTAGYRVIAAADGEEALAKFRTTKIDLVVLDVLMPKLDGFQVCRAIRQSSNVPIIMATVLGSPTDRITGLDLGANDYVVKAFSSRELIARIRSILRRYPSDSRPRQPLHQRDDSPVSVAELTLYPKTRKGYYRDRPIRLTEIEFHILYLLAKSPGQIFSRDRILRDVWGYSQTKELETKALDVHISRLRTKLKSGTIRIMTIQGRGYMLLT